MAKKTIEAPVSTPPGGFCSGCGLRFKADGKTIDLRASILLLLDRIPDKRQTLDEIEEILGAVSDWPKTETARGQLDPRDYDRLFDLVSDLQSEIGDLP